MYTYIYTQFSYVGRTKTNGKSLKIMLVIILISLTY